MEKQKEALVEQMEAILYKIAEQDSRTEQDLECIIAISNWLIPKRVVLHTEMLADLLVAGELATVRGLK